MERAAIQGTQEPAAPPGQADPAGQTEGTAPEPGHAGLVNRIPVWLLAAAAYLALGVALWWHVWTGNPAATMVCACGDPSSFVWFLDWPAYAISHGHSLFFATTAHVPAGMNLLDNTSVLALGVALAPVTWLWGPIASLNVALTLAPALSALAAYVCLRRALGLSRFAAFLGGLLFGFSPFVMRNEAVNHLQVTFQALLPLIFWCGYELAVAQRGKWWRWGLALGVLAALQFFIGSETLTITAMTAGMALLAAIVAAVFRQGALSPGGVLARRLPFAVRGFALAGAVAAVLLAYPLWFALAGPQHIKGADWAFSATNGLLRVLLPLSQSAFQQLHLPQIGYLGPAGTLGAYLGIPAIAVLVAAVIAVRRPLAKLCAVMTLAAVWLSLGATHLPVPSGGEPRWLVLPWRALDHLPVLDKITPANFSAVAVWFVAVAAALLVDRVRPGPGGQPAPSGTWLRGALTRRAAGWAGVGAISAGLVLPWLFAWPLPFTTTAVAAPSWVAQEGASPPSGAVVLFYPFPSSYLDQALVWQARSGMRFSVVGGRGLVAGPDGTVDHGLTPGTPEGTMSGLTTSYSPHSYLALPPRPTPATASAFRSALRRWKVTTVVMTGGGRAPAYARQWLTTVLGTAPTLQNGAWVWDDVQKLIS